MHGADGLGFVVDLVLAVGAAFLGGIVAQRLRQPVIVGYLLAGVLIGPFTPGPTAGIGTVRVLAEIGVAFLMFALGAEVSLGELRRLGRVTTLGGTLQILLTLVVLGPAVALALGLTVLQGVLIGALFALSSTVVALKVLFARGEAGTVHGRAALGVLIAQDIAVVPMVIILPAIATGSDTLGIDLLLAAAKAGAVLLGAYVVGVRAVPWMLAHTAGARSRELFLLAVVSLALGTALVTQLAGLSLAFGAFLAGLVVAESEYRTQVVAEVLPMRDLFASLFFVSVGMLVDPAQFAAHLGETIAFSIIVIAAKTLVAAGALIAAGLSPRVALLAGAAICQVGEFSFVLAQVSVDRGAIPESVFDLTLAIALVTICVTPAVTHAMPHLLAVLEGLPRVGDRIRVLLGGPPPDGDSGDVATELLSQHAVICGYGRVARELVDALAARSLRYVIVEYNPFIVRSLRLQGVPVIYGDASSPAVLEHLHLERARLLALLMPDPAAAEVATRYARAHFPRLDIVVRAGTAAEVERLRRAGATDVVQPEFEGGVEVIRHALRRYGIGGYELTQVITGRRAAFYRHAIEDAADG